MLALTLLSLLQCINVVYCQAYIQVIYNATGEYYTIPSVGEFINLTYKNIKLNIYWKDTCIYITTYFYDREAEVYIDVYGVDENNYMYFLKSLKVRSSGYWCNETLKNYTYIVLSITYPDGEKVGPLALFRPNFMQISIPPDLAPFTPFILVGLIIFVAVYYNLRKSLVGLIALAAFSIWIVEMFVGITHPLLQIGLPALAIVLAAFLAYIVEKHWEA